MKRSVIHLERVERNPRGAGRKVRVTERDVPEEELVESLVADVVGGDWDPLRAVVRELYAMRKEKP